MCGIVGIVSSEDREPDGQLLRRMNDSQDHRGPDGEGFHIERGVGFGHKRLSIIDLAGGAQPMYNEDGSIVTVYNGEIYNFLDLKAELEDNGHRFATRSDTEVIVHGWEEWGADCVRRFNGMFALAVWDRNRRTLFLARDRLGIKPLHYATLTDGSLAFASELKALLAHPLFPREIDPLAVEDYLCFGYVPDPRTIFRAAKKLEPGRVLLLRRGEEHPVLSTYWDVSFAPQPSPKHLQEELIARLRKAVERRLIADVPLGAFLSGGVDSSAVVSMMAGLQRDPVNTCSISFGDPEYNEVRYARAVAERYGTNHREESVQPNDFELIDRLVDFYDEPFADSSAIPTFRVCELARRFVTVALSGDGGDENFGGYTRYQWHVHEEMVRRLFPQSLRGPIFGLLGNIYPRLEHGPKVLRVKETLQALAKPSSQGYLDIVSILKPDARQSLYSRSFRAALQGYDAIEVFKRHDASSASENALARAQYLDFKTYLPGDILTKVDRASMANSLEVRVPMLDHEFVEFAASLPSDSKLVGRDGKHVLKQALQPYLSDDILYRRKMGFAVPLKTWFRGPLREKVHARLSAPAFLDRNLFDPAAVQRIVEEHETSEYDHSPAIWALLMFSGFCERVVEGSQ